MIKIAIMALGTGGTLGHFATVRGLLANLGRRLPFAAELRVATDALNAPFLAGKTDVTMIEQVDHRRGARAGALLGDYAEGLRAFDAREQPDLYIYDTFFPGSFVADVARSGRPNVLLSIQPRQHIRDLFEIDGWSDLFAECCWLREPDELYRHQQQPDEAARDRLIWPVTAPAPFEDAERPHSGPFVVCTCGGGGLPGSEIAMDRLLRLAPRLPDWHFLAVSGPYGKRDRRPTSSNIDLVAYEPNIVTRMVAADLVISEAGYNTCVELTRVARRALLVPGVRKTDDQERRAVRLSRFQGFEVMFPGHLCDDLTEEALERLLHLDTIRHVPDWEPAHDLATCISSVI